RPSHGGPAQNPPSVPHATRLLTLESAHLPSPLAGGRGRPRFAARSGKRQGIPVCRQLPPSHLASCPRPQRSHLWTNHGGTHDRRHFAQSIPTSIPFATVQ